jgi:hypothetical protein
MRALESDQNRRDTNATPMTMAVSKATFQNSFEADMSGSPPKAWFVFDRTVRSDDAPANLNGRPFHCSESVHRTPKPRKNARSNCDAGHRLR